MKDERKKQLASKLDGGPWKFYVFYWKKFFFTKVGDKQRINIQNQVLASFTNTSPDTYTLYHVNESLSNDGGYETIKLITFF